MSPRSAQSCTCRSYLGTAFILQARLTWQEGVQEPTEANVYSSRSHAVLQVTVERKETTPDTDTPVHVGKLSLIDLAGSERAAKTKNQGKRMIEGANINRSLLALGNCINALGDKGARGAYVPFRDSKLTRLLKDSLGGNCRTTMIAACSSARSNIEESLNTLKYANRAKNIQLKAVANVSSIHAHIAEYTQIIADLRLEISRLKVALSQASEEAKTKGEDMPSNPGERETLEKLRNEIVQNFDDRMQIRRSLLDLQELQAGNQQEVRQLTRFLARWEEKQEAESGDEPAPTSETVALGGSGTLAPGSPKEVRVAKLELSHIEANVAKNEELKQALLLRLEGCVAKAQQMQSQFPQMLAAADRRSLLEMEFRVRLMELHNMELEEHSLMREGAVNDRDDRMRDLLAQIQLRDQIIQKQRSHLESNQVVISDDLKEDLKELELSAQPEDMIDGARVIVALPSSIGKRNSRTVGLPRLGRTNTAKLRHASSLIEGGLGETHLPPLPGVQDDKDGLKTDAWTSEVTNERLPLIHNRRSGGAGVSGGLRREPRRPTGSSGQPYGRVASSGSYSITGGAAACTEGGTAGSYIMPNGMVEPQVRKSTPLGKRKANMLAALNRRTRPDHPPGTGSRAEEHGRHHGHRPTSSPAQMKQRNRGRAATGNGHKPGSSTHAHSTFQNHFPKKESRKSPDHSPRDSRDVSNPATDDTRHPQPTNNNRKGRSKLAALNSGMVDRGVTERTTMAQQREARANKDARLQKVYGSRKPLARGGHAGDASGDAHALEPSLEAQPPNGELADIRLSLGSGAGEAGAEATMLSVDTVSTLRKSGVDESGKLDAEVSPQMAEGISARASQPEDHLTARRLLVEDGDWKGSLVAVAFTLWLEAS
ncbi:hypothetical protein CYMTET_10512 [Cymbomonas tetramitiformis]|uniref:Kinesin-like protein n=1 Tax=Cymbomonas tetramitiformis TaxID=36881 RepID=A0AAE0GPM0_9CHLO|nr:hypothetical protein CYMTET_10512 [Cymbomonas tetramitiformis]